MFIPVYIFLWCSLQGPSSLWSTRQYFVAENIPLLGEGVTFTIKKAKYFLYIFIYPLRFQTTPQTEMASHCFPLSCLTIFRDRTIFDGMTLKNDLQTTTQVQSRAGPCVSLHRAQHDPRSWRSPQKPRPTPSCLLRTTSTLIPLHPRTYTWIIRRQFCVLQPRSIRPILALEVLDSQHFLPIVFVLDCAGSSKSWRPQLPIFTHPVTPVHPVVTPTRPGGDQKPQPAIPKYPIWLFASKARLCMSLHNLLCYHTLKNLVYIIKTYQLIV